MNTIQFVQTESKDVDLFAWTCTSATWFRRRFRRRMLGTAVAEEYPSPICRYLAADRSASRREGGPRYQEAPAVQYNVWIWLAFGS